MICSKVLLMMVLLVKCIGCSSVVDEFGDSDLILGACIIEEVLGIPVSGLDDDSPLIKKEMTDICKKHLEILENYGKDTGCASVFSSKSGVGDEHAFFGIFKKDDDSLPFPGKLLGVMKNILHLKIGEARYKDFNCESFKTLGHLKSLCARDCDLNPNAFKGIIKYLTNLNVLKVEKNPNFINFVEAWEQTGDSEIGSYVTHSNLRVLYVAECDLKKKGFEAIFRCFTGLALLDASSNPNLKIQECECNESMKSVASLNVDSCDLDNDDLSKIVEYFPGLKKLSISNNDKIKISGESFKGLENLKLLYILNSSLSNKAVVELFQQFPNLRIYLSKEKSKHLKLEENGLERTSLASGILMVCKKPESVNPKDESSDLNSDISNTTLN